MTTRIAIINPDKCKPNKCSMECKKSCPVVKLGKLCIEVNKTSKIAALSEYLCIGCGACQKACPFDAIKIINIPTNLEKDTVHRYGVNAFKLHRLPMPRQNDILGLVGSNGIGKSTALKILSGKDKMNLGNFSNPPEWQDIINNFKGSELQNYFTKLAQGKLKTVIKPQYVDNIRQVLKGQVKDIIKTTDQKLITGLDLECIMDKNVADLSGGELQRIAIAVVCAKEADVYMFDEITSYLDVKQRLNAAKVIRDMKHPDKYIIVVEHDLSILDYLSDYICCLYGQSGCYGVVTYPFSVREGINIFLDGFIPTENMRFRDHNLNFKFGIEEENEEIIRSSNYKYPQMSKKMDGFELTVDAGDFNDTEITVMLGENGIGKTTFIRMIAGLIESDSEDFIQMNISYKPQMIAPKFTGTVKQLIDQKIRDMYYQPLFISEVVKPLKIEELHDFYVQNLSGGELQRVAILLCLGKPADLYLLDEPSAYLDSEQRIIVSKIIKKFIINSKKTAFIVEHDFIMATYLADRVIVFDGERSKYGHAHSPMSLIDGMNMFLKKLDITFRRDQDNFRPRINKLDSVKDAEQKKIGNYMMTG